MGGCRTATERAMLRAFQPESTKRRISRTLELLDRGPKGSTPFVEAGSKALAVNFVAGDGELTGRVAMDSVQSPYPFGLMLPQSETERLLRNVCKASVCQSNARLSFLSSNAPDTDVEGILRHGSRAPAPLICRSAAQPLSRMRSGILKRASSEAMVSPTGPAPATKTSVFIGDLSL